MTTEPQSALLHFSTDAFAPTERIAAWREFVGRQIVSTNFEPEAPDSFIAEATLRAYQGLEMGSISLGRTRYNKTHGLINSDDLVLATLESGRWWGAQCGREAYLEPGESILIRTSERMEGRMEGTVSIIHVPITAVAPMVGDIGASVLRRIPVGTDALRLLRPYTRTLMD